jgi:signal peptidase II
MLKKITSTGLAWLWVALLVIVLDRYSKYWVLQHLIPYSPVSITRFFNLTLAYNTGAAFSFLHSASGWQNGALGSLAVIVSIYILTWLAKLSVRERWLSVALCLIVGGAISNACDRVLYGFVIDFFDFHLSSWHFAIFNVADSAICVGAFLLVVGWLLKK